jgi:ribonuclease BN (tRNA processing enzyme)
LNLPLNIYGPLGLSNVVIGVLGVTNPKYVYNVMIHEIVPKGFPLEHLPRAALFNNDLPEAQRCAAASSAASAHPATRVRYIFTDRTVNFSAVDASEWSVSGTTIHIANRNNRIVAKQCAETEPLTLAFPEDQVTVTAVLGDHTVSSWGWVIEEETKRKLIPSNMTNTQETVPGPHLRYVSNGHSVAVPIKDPNPAASPRAAAIQHHRRMSKLLDPLADDPVWGPRLHRFGPFRFLNLGKFNPQDPPPALPKGLEDSLAIVTPDNALEVVRGRKITLLFDCSGGLRMHPKSIHKCKNSDILVHEATYYRHDPTMVKEARRKRHSTAMAAANFAQTVKPKVLVLNHFSSKYRSSQFTGLMHNKLWHRTNTSAMVAALPLEPQQSLPLNHATEWHMSSMGHLIEAASTLGLLRIAPASTPTSTSTSTSASDDLAADDPAVDALEDPLSDCDDCGGPPSPADAEISPDAARVLDMWGRVVTQDTERLPHTYGVFTSHDMMLLRLKESLHPWKNRRKGAPAAEGEDASLGAEKTTEDMNVETDKSIN